MIRALVRTACLSTLAWVVLTGVTWAQGQIDFSKGKHFPMVGIAFNQTLQVNLSGPESCDVSVGFFDKDAGATEIISFAYTAFKIQYVRQTDNDPIHGRIQRRVTILALKHDGSACPLRTSLEVFDNLTGISSVAVNPGPIGGQPGPISSPIGMTGLETTRLNLVAYPPGPCHGTLGFFDASGNPTGTTKVVDLAPGTADFLDLTPPAGTGVFQRIEVLPVFTPTPGTDSSACAASIEVFDKFSGRTHTWIQPGPIQ